MSSPSSNSLVSKVYRSESVPDHVKTEEKEHDESRKVLGNTSHLGSNPGSPGLTGTVHIHVHVHTYVYTYTCTCMF